MESFYVMMKVDKKRLHNLVRYQSFEDVQDTLVEQREANPNSRITLHLYIYESLDSNHQCTKWCVNHIKTRRKLVYESTNKQLLRYNYLERYEREGK
jgi:hypothetical protein